MIFADFLTHTLGLKRLLFCLCRQLKKKRKAMLPTKRRILRKLLGIIQRP